jgi:hypothetical protein
MARVRAVAGRPVTLKFRVEDEELGELVDSTSPVQVTVRDSAGAILAQGPAAHEALGVYTYRMSAPPELDTLSAEAAAVVGGLPVSLKSEVVVVGDRVFPLSSLQDVPAEKRLELEDYVATGCEQIIGYSPVPAPRRITFRLREARTRISLGVPMVQDVLSFTDEGGAEMPVLLRNSGLERADGMPFPGGVYTLHLVAGLPSVPADLAEALRLWAGYLAQDKQWDPRVVRVMSEGTESYLARIGEDRPTGFPDVDYVLCRYRLTSTAIGYHRHAVT